MQVVIEHRKRYDYEISPREQDEICQMLRNTDNEFIPSLSSMESTTQHTLHGSPELESPDRYYESLKTQEFIIAKIDDRVVGLISFYRTLGNTIYISTVVVDPWHRNKGVCTKLYQAIQQLSGWECLKTQTWSTNNDYIRLLKKIGFHSTRWIQDHRGDGIHTIYFEKIQEM